MSVIKLIGDFFSLGGVSEVDQTMNLTCTAKILNLDPGNQHIFFRYI